MSQTLQVLILEDSPADAELIIREVRRAGFDTTWRRVDTEESFLTALAVSPDVILSDYSLPRFDGLRALALVRERKLDIPFILISGTLGEENAVEAIKLGADDYLLKDRTTRLGHAIQRALAEKQLRDQHRRAAEALEQGARHAQLAADVALALTRKGSISEVLQVCAEAVVRHLDVAAARIWTLEAEGSALELQASAGNDAGLERPGRSVPAREHRIGTIARAKRTFLTNAPAADPAVADPSWTRREGVVAFAGQPLMVDDRVVGVVGLYARRPLCEATINTLQIVADGVAVGIERKRADEALRESEEKFRTLAESLDVVVWLADPGLTTIHFVNSAYERTWGRSRESLSASPRSFIDGIHPEDRPWVLERMAVQGYGQWDLEYRILRPDGVIRWIHDKGVGIRDPAGRITRIAGVAMDITERRDAEERSRKLACAVEQSPVSIVITDRLGRIEFVNPRFTQVTGYTLEEARGQNPRILKSGNLPMDTYRQLWETIATGGVWQGVFQNRRKDGSLFWETASIAPLRNDNGDITHFVAVKEDVTEKRLMEAKLLRAQRVESIGSLASGIAHDLNNILAPIILCAPLLRQEEPGDSQEELIQTIESSAQRAVGVVRQLLSFARGKEGHRVSLQVRHLIREVSRIARETFPRNIQIKELCEPDLWPVVGDATQLHQVLLNLSVNARDAMPRGGTLVLRASNVVVDPHDASAQRSGSSGPHVRIRVEDTGIGMDEAVQKHIFESFFTTKGEELGTGLGLCTVQGIVRDHGGWITFTSRLGEGTLFEVHLPAVPDQISPAETTSPLEGIPRGRGELIMVVDDEGALADATRRALERHGFSVVQAGDGIEALSVLSARGNDVRAVVTDFMMPLMDGVALCRAVRSLAPEIPVIVSSGGLFGKAGEEALRAFADLGVAHILHKPHNAEPLLRAVSEALRPHSQKTD